MAERKQDLQIYCDFDGTITEKDMIITILERFGPPGWDLIKEDVLSRKVSVQDGVGRMFALIASEKLPEMEKYAKSIVQIRAGFPAFMEYINDQNIEFYVTSGGMDFFVLPILQPWVRTDQIYCNHANTTGPKIEIQWPHACDVGCSGGCGCCKPSIMRQTKKDGCKQIVIGDSVTDVKAAREADYVIARGLLVDFCKEEHIPYMEFGDFFDVLQSIKRLQQEG